MKNLFDKARAEELKERVARLTPESPRQWGKMSPAQAVAHCALGLQLPSGEQKPPRAGFPVRILGRIIKPLALGDDKPMRRNSPTIPMLVMVGDCDLARERERLCAAIDQFAAAGPAGCTDHPHTFFGRLTPNEWAILMYKHVDHHLRQFGV
jgi:hypothetical protein